ncbi:MAG: hypothetical protein CEE40_09405 [Chloroflexi bacterium B3_Chlor]|nr:MAG: hypothetical protein CEE40_09405 [Chloroflexi bacterium B3_Chlor]
MTSRARAQVLIHLLTATLLVSLGSSPLWSQEGGGTPRAIGYVSPDGETGISQFTVEAQDGPEPTYGMALGIPSEPPGHRLVYLTNLERVGRGIPPLKAASELMNAAQFHSDWMAQHNCFDHDCPGEPTWIQRISNAGYSSYEALGENIAHGYYTASGAVNGWMGSAEHRANMLHRGFREAGGGYAFSSSSRYLHYWALDFGSRGQVYPVIINNEAWSTTDLVADLYVHGRGWADWMQFRNEGGNWSGWESFSARKTWTLSCTDASPTTVYAQIRQESTVLEFSDEIHVDISLSVQPNPLIFLSEQGWTTAIPESYQLDITSCDNWTAQASEPWIKLSDDTGTGPGEVAVSLEGFPTNPGRYTGTVTVIAETTQEQTDVQVILVVTDGPLEHSYAPLVTKEQA